jgi:hypothetical protein
MTMTMPISDVEATAFMQKRPRMTVKQAAQLMNVSERQVYLAKELVATGREDLVDTIMAGRMSLPAALKIAKPAKYDRRRNRYHDLVKAWNACSEDQRAAFAAQILHQLERERCKHDA